MTKYDLNNVDNYDNIAELFDDEFRKLLSEQLIEIFNIDDTSREGKKQIIDKIVKLAMMTQEEKNYPFPGASNVIMPLISEAALGFGSTAYPSLVKGDSIVKPKIIGSDEGRPVLNQKGEPLIEEDQKTPKMQNVGLKQATGERIAEFMNWQLTQDIENWREEKRKLCYCLPIVGTLFKKVSYDILNKKVCTDLIFPDKMIINDKAKESKYTTKTHIIELTRQEVVEKVRADIYLDLDYFEGSDSEAEDKDSSELKIIDMMETHEFLEMHCWVDLDEDGLSEPYIVTISRNTQKIARIVARFTKADIIQNNKEIIHIHCEEYFIKYGFIPSPDGGYYDIGYGHLLYSHNNTVNSAINQLIDSGHLKNAGGGFLGKGIRLRGGNLRFKPGEWKFVDTNGQALRDNIFAMPVGEPSATLFQLMDYLVQSAMRLSAVSKILKGEIPANLPAETIPAVMAEAAKDFKAIYKSIYLSLEKEFKLISKINQKELKEETYQKVLNDDNADKEKDFKVAMINIVPVSDPESVINVEKMTKASVLMTLKDDPFINQIQIRKDLLESYGINNTEDYISIPPEPTPPPNPLAEAEMIKLEGKKMDLQIKEKELQIKEKELQLQLMIKVEKEKVGIVKTMAETEKIEAETREIEHNIIDNNNNN